MTQCFVTVVAPIDPDHVEPARGLIDALGNPAAEEIRTILDGDARVHFASLNVLVGSKNRAHLVFEFSADGDEPEALHEVARILGPALGPIFALASDWRHGSLERYWQRHAVRVGQGYFEVPGLPFSGTPDMSVRRIRDERVLFGHLLTQVADGTKSGVSGLTALDRVRQRIANDSKWQWALVPEPTRTLGVGRALGIKLIIRIGWSFAATYLWPLLALVLVTLSATVLIRWSVGLSWGWREMWWPALESGGLALLAGTAALIAAAAAAYAVLRRRESTDKPETRRADPGLVAAIMERENRTAQNHLAALFVMKPGLLRKLAIRLVFRLIGELATRTFRPGFLGTLGTIHFARWVMVPGTGDLLFFSNYDGSWESYLEDFITLAHNGLTGVWSNTEGFPPTENLFQKGATDGARFKNWARRWQTPTGFWYSAYPDLTTTAIRRNAAVRQGLGAARTENEAQQWLSLFGSQERPESALELNEIQSLIFGGLGFLNAGMFVSFRFSEDGAAARRWLGEVAPLLAFGDGRKHRGGVVTLGLTGSGLQRLGLPRESLATYPQAFLDGMTAPWRSRALGDTHENAPSEWWWGGAGDIDGMLLLYAPSDNEVKDLRTEVLETLSRAGHGVASTTDFISLPSDEATSLEKDRARREPFGFIDGISQPVIRGSYKALRSADPIHIVEAGEFILGYPDNRGFVSPTPTIDAKADPSGTLPAAAPLSRGFARPLAGEPRDVGRNGTFLAVRQLEQDIDTFARYSLQVNAELQRRFPDWRLPEDFVAAKMVGRWPDGSSLVRYPYAPASDSGEESPSLSTSGRPLTRAGAGATQVIETDVPSAPLGAGRGGRPGIPEPDNDFLFGAEDPQGLRCPFGAHIRRANPRESLDPGSTEQLSITNRHRIVRVGRKYAPTKGQQPGLFFMCLNADLERQFEFVQQTWLQHGSFHGLPGERDPLLGDRRSGTGFTVPTRSGPIALSLPDFVRMRGGGYFFLPSRSLVQFLSS